MHGTGYYKDKAIESLSGRWLQAAVATLIVCVVMELPSLIDLRTETEGLANLLSLLLLPLPWGFAVFTLYISRYEPTDYGTLFDGFKDYGRIFTTMLLMCVYTTLWSVLLIVPGIIKAYSYAMTPYILADEPQLKNNAAIEKSMRMMRGHKMDLFLLDLSFIGWFLLSCLTLGLGFLLLFPYWQTARAHFYQDLLGNDM